MNKAELTRRLANDFVIRFHMSLILTCTAMGGALFSWSLLKLGITTMSLRYGLATLGAYLVFFGTIRLWIAQITNNVFPRDTDSGSFLSTTTDEAFDILETAVEPADLTLDAWDNDDTSEAHQLTAWATASTNPGAAPDDTVLGSISSDVDTGDLEGGLALILLIAIALAVLGAGIYVIWEAPLILSDAAFQFALAAGLIRPSQCLDDPNWAHSVLKTTWKPFAVILILAIAAGAIGQAAVPDAIRMSDVIRAL